MQYNRKSIKDITNKKMKTPIKMKIIRDNTVNTPFTLWYFKYNNQYKILKNCLSWIDIHFPGTALIMFL